MRRVMRLRIVVDGRVAVGCSDVGHHERASGNDHLSQLEVFARHSDEDENDWGITHQLVDRVAGQLATRAQQCPLVGVVMQEVNRCCQLVAGGVGTGGEQRGGQHEKFAVAEAVTVVLGADQVRDQVLGEVVPALREHLFAIGVELGHAAAMAGSSLVTFHSNIFLMSSVHAENSCQS
jgi:hypothetical protein